MYATCLFCHAALGANESIEHFPVGRRLAFDAAKGRLWVVCAKCERWNLSPLEERWEAIEEAERAYRDTKKRVATDNIGLARLRDGTDLIRIGEPLRPEFAAWRYGRSLVRRRQRELVTGGAIGAGVIASIVLAAPFAPGIAGAATFGALQMFGKRGLWKPGVRLFADDGSLVRVTGMMLEMSSVSRQPDGDFALNVMRRTLHRFPLPRWISRKPFSMETSPYLPARFIGREANRVLGALMPVMNRFGGGSREVGKAVQVIERSGTTPAQLLANLSRDDVAAAERRFKGTSMDFLLLAHLPAATRLALEMSLHEDSERRALEGELDELARRWKEAEEIAAISDSLFLPDQSE